MAQIAPRPLLAAAILLGLVTACGSPAAVPSSPGPAITSPAQPSPSPVSATEQPATSEPTLPAPVERTTGPTPAAEPTPNDGSTAVDVAGSWVGTINEDADSQGIRFSLNQILNVITGTALLESGDVQQVTATLDGNTLTLEYTGGVRVVYEGTIDGNAYNGSFKRYLSDQVVGSGTFETTREE
jgi:hypothetical protein